MTASDGGAPGAAPHPGQHVNAGPRITLNRDERLIEDAITERTKAILPVHYAGVACEMEEIMRLAAEHQLLVIEDAAQGVCASFRGRALGGIGDLGCVSFHETKNVHCGE